MTKNVNLKVEIHVELEDIIPSETGSSRVCVLRVNGKSPALAGLMELRNRHKGDYDKVMYVARLVATNQEIFGKHVKRGKGRCRDLFEMRGGHARLFFFRTPDTDQIVVCTNTYWKTKPSKQEQGQAFETCGKLRDVYLEWRDPATKAETIKEK